MQNELENPDLFDENSELFLNQVSMNISKIRESKKMTKLDVSRQLGFMYPDHYSKMELRSGGKHFNLKHIYKLSKIFNIDIEDLIKNN